MTDLVAFLRARLDEDEQHARAATDGPWQARSIEAGWCVDVEPTTRSGYVICTGPRGGLPVDLFHVARHDPARVLRGVEAKRQLLDLIVQSLPGNCDCEAYGHHTDAETALRLLASEWSDHPDYRQDWTATP